MACLWDERGPCSVHFDIGGMQSGLGFSLQYYMEHRIVFDHPKATLKSLKNKESSLSLRMLLLHGELRSDQLCRATKCMFYAQFPVFQSHIVACLIENQILQKPLLTLLVYLQFSLFFCQEG